MGITAAAVYGSLHGTGDRGRVAGVPRLSRTAHRHSSWSETVTAPLHLARERSQPTFCSAPGGSPAEQHTPTGTESVLSTRASATRPYLHRSPLKRHSSQIAHGQTLS